MTLPLVALVLVAPVLLLASAVVSLSAHGPLGWLASALLLLAVAAGTRAAWRRCRAWWASTKAPVRSGGGTGRAAGAPPGRPGGTSRG